MSRKRLDWHDVEELAANLCGLDPDDYESDAVEQALWDKFEVSFECFEKLINALVPFTVGAVSPLSGTGFQGFVKDGCFICKIEMGK